MNKSGVFGGLILVVVGGFLLANNLGEWHMFSMERLWPIFVLIPGLVFELSYFSRDRNPGILVPGGILTILGLLFFFETFTDWQFAAFTWPVYPLAVAIGLFQLYIFSGRPRGLLVPVFILTAVSGVAFATMFINTIQQWVNLNLVFPSLLVLAGLLLIFRSSGAKSRV
ncbi:LiaI-LiaF-like domain-containing protein [Desulfosporosinus fructosivorans]